MYYPTKSLANGVRLATHTRAAIIIVFDRGKYAMASEGCGLDDCTAATEVADQIGRLIESNVIIIPEDLR